MVEQTNYHDFYSPMLREIIADLRRCTSEGMYRELRAKYLAKAKQLERYPDERPTPQD